MTPSERLCALGEAATPKCQVCGGGGCPTCYETLGCDYETLADAMPLALDVIVQVRHHDCENYRDIDADLCRLCVKLAAWDYHTQELT